jgi:hypothetical protein
MKTPDVTLSPADKMTAKEWHEAKADRRIKEAMYTALAERLAYLETKHACKSCDKPNVYGDDALCPICRAWANAAEARLTNREATRRLKVALVAAELSAMLRVIPISDLYSPSYHAISLRPYEDSLREAHA